MILIVFSSEELMYVVESELFIQLLPAFDTADLGSKINCAGADSLDWMLPAVQHE